MDWGQTALVALGYFIAGMVKGATGLGYSTTALPILTLAIGLRAAMPLVLVPSMASNLAVMVNAGHFRETVQRFWPLYCALVPGLVLGLTLLLGVNQDRAAAVLGVVIVGYCLFALLQPTLVLPERFQGWLQIPVGFVNGVVNGMTGSQIMPLVPFMLSLQLDADRFVQAVNVGFTLSSLVMMVGLSRGGVLTPQVLALSIAGIVPAVIGGWVGSALRRRLPEAGFRRLVLVVLLVLGALLVSRVAG